VPEVWHIADDSGDDGVIDSERLCAQSRVEQVIQLGNLLERLRTAALGRLGLDAEEARAWPTAEQQAEMAAAL